MAEKGILNKLNAPQIVIFSFLIAIFAGTILLELPWATRGGISLIDAFFTATSATCVTGLIVVDTGTYFTRFGQLVILVLIQMGGLGIMTFSCLFAILLGGKITIRGRMIMQSALNHDENAGTLFLIRNIVVYTLIFEAVGATILFFHWRKFLTGGIFERAYQAIFHAISGFCNAGFSLFKTSLTQFRGDVLTNLVMITLIISGGIGFFVLIDLAKLRFNLTKKNLEKNKISLQTKIVVTSSIILIGLTFIVLFVLERENTLKGLSSGEKILASFFHAVTPRTAGFNTLNVAKMHPASHFFMLLLMFIGASPGGTGGGIKTCTFVILLFIYWSMLKNKGYVSIFGRTIPRIIIRKAMVVFALATSWIFLATLLLLIAEGKMLDQSGFLRKALFEVTSAFGTVGLTTGITSNLSFWGRLLITVTMFVGRIGPLTLALAIAHPEERKIFKYPEEKVMIG